MSNHLDTHLLFEEKLGSRSGNVATIVCCKQIKTGFSWVNVLSSQDSINRKSMSFWRKLQNHFLPKIHTKEMTKRIFEIPINFSLDFSVCFFPSQPPTHSWKSYPPQWMRSSFPSKNMRNFSPKNISSWWLFPHPFETYARRIGSFPQGSRWK